MQSASFHTCNEITTQMDAWEQAMEMVARASLPKAEDYRLRGAGRALRGDRGNRQGSGRVQGGETPQCSGH